MEAPFKCEECGGTECYLESGYYYCQECHIQAHGFREALFELQETTGGLGGKKISSKKKDKPKKKEQISTFETYNYILLGLVNELIACGAKRELRAAVKYLWFKYLEKLEVINKGLPKLPAVFSKVDAEIFYDRKSKKRKKTSYATSDSGSETETTSRSVRTKRKKNFLNENYEFEASFLSQDANSLTNQSLTSLKSSEKEDVVKLRFNKKAVAELLKKQSKASLNRGCSDSDMLPKLTYRSVSAAYKNSPNLLTRNKLYCLIYLGLLLVKDRIQLGDLLRLIREGRISYNSVTHFFPEEMQQNNSMNLSHYIARKLPFTHLTTRQTSAELAKLLKITTHIPIQNLVDLCERYCEELNLPRAIFKCVLKIIAKTAPSMKVHKNCSVMPNYEARAMSFVIFIMKLLFGLDDETEYRFSEFAKIINNINKDSELHLKTMFVFDDWMKHIQYRRCVLNHYHFPIKFPNEQSLKHVDLFANFLKKNDTNLNQDNDKTLRAEFEVYKKLLSDLQEKHFNDENLRFYFSFTPFRDYCTTILKTDVEYLPQLSLNFSKKSLSFLLEPYTYLKLINGDEKVQIKHRGANKQIRFTRVLNPRHIQYRQRTNRRKYVKVKIVDNIEELEEESDENDMIINSEIHHDRIIKAHKTEYRIKHKKNLEKMQKLSSDINIPQNKIIHREEDVYDVHYNPFETFWISSRHMDRFISDKESFEDYLQSLPHSFVFLVEECARILEMDQKHLLEEYVSVELYLCHVAKFCRTRVHSPVMEKEVQKLINRAKRQW